MLSSRSKKATEAILTGAALDRGLTVEKKDQDYVVRVEIKKDAPLPPITTFLPYNAKYYPRGKPKGAGKNPGYFSHIDVEFNDEDKNKKITRVPVLVKKSTLAQDISEKVTGAVQNILGDLTAEIGMCINENKTDNMYGPNIISVLYQGGFSPLWRHMIDNFNISLLLEGQKTIPMPTVRPTNLGTRRKDWQFGLGEPIKDKTQLNVPFKDFYKCFAMAFVTRNFDFHFDNVAVVFREAKTNAILANNDKRMLKINELIALRRECLKENDLTAFIKADVEYKLYLKDQAIVPSCVLIDFGWASYNEKGHVACFLLKGETGIETGAFSFDGIGHFPGLEPTNHFKEIMRFIKCTPAFAEAFETLAAEIEKKQSALEEGLKKTFAEIGALYGKKGLMKYAKEHLKLAKSDIGADLEAALVKFRLDSLNIEAAILKKVAFQTRMSLCFPRLGKWDRKKGVPEWISTPKAFLQEQHVLFTQDHDMFDKVIKDYENEVWLLQDLAAGRFNFVGFEQQAHQPILKNIAKQFLTDYLKKRDLSLPEDPKDVKKEVRSPKSPLKLFEKKSQDSAEATSPTNRRSSTGVIVSPRHNLHASKKSDPGPVISKKPSPPLYPRQSALSSLPLSPEVCSTSFSPGSSHSLSSSSDSVPLSPMSPTSPTLNGGKFFTIPPKNFG